MLDYHNILQSMIDTMFRFSLFAVKLTSFLPITLFIIVGYHWEGTVLGIIFLLSKLYSVIYLKINNLDLFEERINPTGNIITFEKLYWALNVPIHILAILISSLDSVIFHWTSLSCGIRYAGLAMFVLGECLYNHCMNTNKFYTIIFKIREDSEHFIINEGAYKLVRHPGYLGVSLFTLGYPMYIGSRVGLYIDIFLVAMIFIRCEIEDFYLLKELPKYANYARTVKYKIIPFIF